MALLPKRAPRQQRRYTATYYLGERRIGTEPFTRKQVNDGSAHPEQLIVAKAKALGLKVTSQYPDVRQHNQSTVRFSINVEKDGRAGVLHLNWS